jgi:hypothetical protein
MEVASKVSWGFKHVEIVLCRFVRQRRFAGTSRELFQGACRDAAQEVLAFLLAPVQVHVQGS